LPQLDYHKPGTVEEAWRLQSATKGARYLAGGTDLLVQLRSRGEQPAALISLRSIPELQGIELNAGAVIGGGVVLADVIRHPGLAVAYPLLCQAARSVGSPQIRNVATLAGNLCNASPCADSAPALLVLDARVRLRGPEGERELALQDFFQGPGLTARHPAEILTAVILPPPVPGSRGFFSKKGRVGMDLAKVSVAAALQLRGTSCTGARIAVGSVAPVPLRLPRAERILLAGPLSEDRLAQAAEAARQAVAPITDLRSSAAYRRRLVGTLLQRGLRELQA